jgi:hypothetical protein
MTSIISTNTYGFSEYVVSPNLGQGNYTTIQSAINDASAGDTIFICDGTYNENITLTPGISLTSNTTSGQTKNVLLTGTLSYTGGVDVNISNIGFQSDNGYSINFTGSTAGNINLYQCSIYTSSSNSFNFANSSASSGITVYNCICELITNAAAFLLQTSPGSFVFFNSTLGNGSTNYNSITLQNGNVAVLGSYVEQGFLLSASSSLFCYNSQLSALSTIFTIDTGTIATFYDCLLTANKNSSVNNAIYLYGTGTISFLNTYFQDFAGLATVGGSGGNVSILSIYPSTGTTLNFGSASVSYQNGKYGNINANSLTSLNSLSTAPASSQSSSLALGTAYQNTLGYDILLTVYIEISSTTNANLLLGVGPTNTPTQQNILTNYNITPGFTHQLFPVPIYLPNNYYALLSKSGTVTANIVGQLAMPI